MKTHVLLFKFIFSIICLLVIFYLVPTETIVDGFRSVSLFTYCIALLLIMGNVLISSFRIQYLAKGLNLKLGFGDIHRINVYSQVFGMLAFQSVGQMAFRSTYSAKYTSRPQYFAFLTLIEKIVALAILIVFALLGVFFVTKGAVQYEVKFGSIFITMTTLIVAVGLSYFFVLSSIQRTYCRKIVHHILKLKIGITLILSLVMHLLMLAAYVMLAQSLMSEISLLIIIGAFSIAMLGAAIPISFAGWGIRELSAGFIFIYLGLNSEVGVSVALLVGVLSIIALAIHAIIVYFLNFKQRDIEHADVKSGENKKFHVEKGVAFICALFVPILIGVQIKVPTNQGLLSVNTADPLAILCALSFLAFWIKNRRCVSGWRIRGLSIALISFVGLITYGWLVGYFKNGLSEWATYNRLFGLIVVFAYLFTGVTIITMLKTKIIRLMIHTFIVTSMIILFAYLFMSPLLNLPTLNELGWVTTQFNGLMTNRNALAFMLCLFLSLSIAIPHINYKWHRSIIIGLLIGLIFLTLSRTGMATAVIIMLAATFFRYCNLKEMLGIFCVVGALLFSVYLQTVLYSTSLSLLFDESFINVRRVQDVTVSQFGIVHSERLASYIWAWDMWLENQVFGAGLGAFISTHESDFSIPLTIHNTALWIAAEMGLVGLFLIAPLPLCIIMHVKKSFEVKLAWEDFALALVLITFVIFSMAHEVLYQRSFWLTLGLLCANQLSIRGISAVKVKSLGVVVRSKIKMPDLDALNAV